jgi:hypothetical protein
MKKALLFITTLLTILSAKAQNYYAVSPTSDSLYNASSISGIDINEGIIKYNNGTVAGFTGMAKKTS